MYIKAQLSVLPISDTVNLLMYPIDTNCIHTFDEMVHTIYLLRWYNISVHLKKKKREREENREETEIGIQILTQIPQMKINAIFIKMLFV